jgi:hypothetical protein
MKSKVDQFFDFAERPPNVNFKKSITFKKSKGKKSFKGEGLKL